MKKTLAALVLIATALATQAQTTSGPQSDASFSPKMSLGGPIAYPGGVWGTMVYSAKAPDGYLKWRVEGVVDQGVDWFRFGEGGSWKFNTYAGFEYVFNDEARGVTPMVGLKVNKRFTDGSLDLGLRWKHGNTYLSPVGTSSAGGSEKVSRVEAYATYWFSWNLKKE